MTINHESRNITLTQDAYLSSDTRFIDNSDYPHGAYEASGFDDTTGESCTVIWEALTEDDSEDNADWKNPTTVIWNGVVSEYFEELVETANAWIEDHMDGMGMDREEFYKAMREDITNAATHSDMFSDTAWYAQEAGVDQRELENRIIAIIAGVNQ